MRFVLLSALVLFAIVYVANSQHLPQVLIHRARELIQRAEFDLHQHHQHGRSHLTQALEQEIHLIHQLVRELEQLEQSRHMDYEEVHKVEERLLHHENKLAEETARIEETHGREIEEGHRAHEHRNREGHQDRLIDEIEALGF